MRSSSYSVGSTRCLLLLPGVVMMGRLQTTLLHNPLLQNSLARARQLMRCLGRFCSARFLKPRFFKPCFWTVRHSPVRHSPVPAGSRVPLPPLSEPPSQSRLQGLWGAPGARESNYWAESSAPAETLWQMVSNLTNLVHWHPIITATNAPLGQRAKPGLIYKAFSRYLPLSTSIFVERVLPGELVSIRLFPLPGVQERVTYRIVSTLCGTCVLYSMTLSGWLSPLVWPMLKPQAPRVAVALVQAAEAVNAHGGEPVYIAPAKADIFG